MKMILRCMLLVLVAASSQGQGIRVTGRFADASRGFSLRGLNVSLAEERDTSTRSYTIADTAGKFEFTASRNRGYRLEASRIGYVPLRRMVTTGSTDLDLGTMTMTERVIPLGEVLIEGRVPPAEQKGDTTEYTAKAFTMNKDASAEDLVKKLPGVTVDNTGVKAQGEDVQQVLVDGRPFFGTDPTLALRNLPSEVIDKVQVFDKLSDQAQLTGFDDGQSVKTMNIVTRVDRRQGEFGRFNAGYGDEDRYIATGNLNSFTNNRRLSIIGLSNNINQQNFSAQDLLGVMGGGNQRGGGGGGGGMFGRGGGRQGGRTSPGGTGPGGGASNFLVGQSTGVSTVNSLGANYADSVGGGGYAIGSYFFNMSDNDNPQTLDRQYTFGADSSTRYHEVSGSDKKNHNHRLNFRFEGAIDSMNSFIVTPQLNLQENHSTGTVDGANTSSANDLLGRSNSSSLATTSGYNFQGHAVFRHKFGTPGRTISLDAGFGGNRKQSDSRQYSLNQYAASPSDTLDEQSGGNTNGYSLSSNLTYTEPVGTFSLLEFNYNPSYSRNFSDNRTYYYNQALAGYTDLNTLLSNSFDNTYTTQNAGMGYRMRIQSFSAIANVGYQIADLRGNQTYPGTGGVDKTFYTVLPSLMLNYEASRRNNLRLFYRAQTASPNISQMQNVVDNSNPLVLSTGNPDLKQSYSHTLLARLMFTNPESGRSLMLFGFASFTNNYIGNSTIVARRDTTAGGGVSLSRGTQLTMPVNLDGSRSFRSFCTFGTPFSLISSTLNFNAGVTLTRSPGLINGVLNVADVLTYSPGLVIGSNISEDVDFTLSYTANFNRSVNSAQPRLDNNYFSQVSGLRFNWNVYSGFLFRTDVNNSLTSGLGNGLDYNTVIWNCSLGKKILTDERGEFLFSVFDLLNQNKSVNRTVTDSYVEDAVTRVLTRYVMLSFTYTLRQFQPQRPPDLPRDFDHWH